MKALTDSQQSTADVRRVLVPLTNSRSATIR